MNEYLVNYNGVYALVKTNSPKDGYIEVPDGAEMFVRFNEFDKHYFYKGGFSEIWQDDGYWDNDMSDYIEYCKKESIVLWQRHTQPESLPFVDDDVQGINDQYAEIEKVRQAVKVNSGGGVDATLKERQSQYGCFEDVAFVTQGIIELMNRCNYKNMPQPHQMALYMIASKMARIVNGDFNHKDSWHDIQGYAKLIEDLL